LQTEQTELTTETKELLRLASNGWVLVDFPCSYAQAKLLEQALSGYKPKEELEPTLRDAEIE
jgi:adenylate kinase family enzyme